jgi:hypothetical protein
MQWVAWRRKEITIRVEVSCRIIFGGHRCLLIGSHMGVGPSRAMLFQEIMGTRKSQVNILEMPICPRLYTINGRRSSCIELTRVFPIAYTSAKADN